MGSFLKRHHWITPLALLAPGLVWLLVFYLYPAFQMFMASFWSGSFQTGFTFSLSNWVNYPNSVSTYASIYVRSVLYAGAATVTTFLIAYPLAYTIAFKGGRYKNLLLFLVVAPFFTSFLLRTISWKIILSDSGPVLGPLKAIGLIPQQFHLLASPMAVIAGITYAFLPFMTLPIYVALEKVDYRLVEAAKDLYAGPWRPGGAVVGAVVGGVLLAVLGFVFNANPITMAIAGAVVGGVLFHFMVSESFVRVTFPLSMSGVFAGGLLTFIPAIGDYVNAELLGGPNTSMIGNVIQSKFLTENDYPSASALSFVMMFGVLIVVTVYARILGTEELSAAAARA
jgi:spermidine/putrescine transport system permease protein